ncbi:hypothetical protein TH53_19810 [Pedobacter lusitanus]|uniref:NinG protein n=1 Tax=Pedobacter lusitanus TaxID=1503925 RepID=A0A0D0GMA4_9SPHI|nr:recombination protein NinG [Pedobacter lusitanus]KIO75586.1 hypothetical protein TH53_19810 [Pedobacter lusitanus]
MSVYDKKSVPQLLQIAQKHFNAFIRARDMKDGYFICISCNKWKHPDKMQAGHYFSAGHHSYLRFNEDNVHGQCMACNCHLSGNLIKYRVNLLKKIGQDQLSILEDNMHMSQKWDRYELIEIIDKYKDLNKKGVM